MAKMKAPAGVSSFTHEGKEIAVKKGRVEVPQHVANVLESHGFRHIGDDDLTDDERQALEAEQAEAEAARQAEAEKNGNGKNGKK